MLYFFAIDLTIRFHENASKQCIIRFDLFNHDNDLIL